MKTSRRSIAALWLAMFLQVASAQGESRALRTRNVVLITADGLRYQELFRGLDEALLNSQEFSGVDEPEPILARLRAASRQERRRRLLPFFWETLGKEGMVVGNRDLGSEVVVENPHRFSAPGYSEILVGQALASVDSNDRVRIERETVLEFVRRKLNLRRDEVAVFASWDVFEFFSCRDPDSVLVNAGYDRLQEALLSDPAARRLNLLQFEMLTPWDSVRHDSVTAELALDYLRTQRPRLLYVALGETDDWAHDRRYDRYLTSIGLLDDFLRDLWETVQSVDSYQDSTTLLVTSDHGRGPGVVDWTDHGEGVRGSESIWFAALGPDTPALGETGSGSTFTQGQVAATICTLMGLEVSEFNPAARPAISLVVEGRNGLER